MKKRLIAALLLVAMVLSLAACAKKTTVHITIKNIGEFEVLGAPAGIENMSSDGTTINVAVKKDGTYPITVRTDDGTEYVVTLKYEKGTAYVEGDEALEFVAGVG